VAKELTFVVMCASGAAACGQRCGGLAGGAVAAHADAGHGARVEAADGRRMGEGVQSGALCCAGPPGRRQGGGRG
jgi:hypothetical protein